MIFEFTIMKWIIAKCAAFYHNNNDRYVRELKSSNSSIWPRAIRSLENWTEIKKKNGQVLGFDGFDYKWCAVSIVLLCTTNGCTLNSNACGSRRFLAPICFSAVAAVIYRHIWPNYLQINPLDSIQHPSKWVGTIEKSISFHIRKLIGTVLFLRCLHSCGWRHRVAQNRAD